MMCSLTIFFTASMLPRSSPLATFEMIPERRSEIEHYERTLFRTSPTRQVNERQVRHLRRLQIQANHIVAERELPRRTRRLLPGFQGLRVEVREETRGEAGVQHRELCAAQCLFELRLVCEQRSEGHLLCCDFVPVLVGLAAQEDLALPGARAVDEAAFHGAARAGPARARDGDLWRRYALEREGRPRGQMGIRTPLMASTKELWASAVSGRPKRGRGARWLGSGRVGAPCLHFGCR